MSVHPSLTYRELDAALAQLSRAFGFAVQVEARDGDAIRAAALTWAQGAVMVQPELPDELHGPHAGQGWVYVEVGDIEAHHARASASGAVEILNDPHDAFDGTQRGYSARDLEGNLWSFGTANPSPSTQPAADRDPRLARLEPLLGAWTEQVSIRAVPPGRMTFKPILGGRFVVQRSEIADPAFPDSWTVIAVDENGDGYTQHYYDARGLARIYAMTFDGNHWTLRREVADFTPLTIAQRFHGTLSADGNTITGTWESRRAGQEWHHDFDVTYTREAAP